MVLRITLMEACFQLSSKTKGKKIPYLFFQAETSTFQCISNLTFNLKGLIFKGS